MRVSMRPAEPADIPSVAGLWMAMVEHHRRLVGDQWPVLAPEVAWERRRRQYSSWLTEGSGFILLAHAEGEETPIGYLACRLLPAGPTFDFGELRGDVDSLVTAESARAQGVGSAMLDAWRDELKRRGIRYWSIGVPDANAGATALYERHGFRPFVRSMLGAVDEGRRAYVPAARSERSERSRASSFERR